MPTDTARMVEVRNGGRQISSAVVSSRGTEGFYIVDCDEAEALDIAERMPVAKHGAVEVRPLMTLPEHMFK